MKVCLLGAQGTGKTTLVNLFRKSCNVIDGIARNVIAHGGVGNQQGDFYSQRRIFKDYESALKVGGALKEGYLSTRSVIDVYAYTKYLEEHHNTELFNAASRGERILLMLEVWREMRAIKRWLRKNPDVVICYIPIQFGVEPDDVRSPDTKYQLTIDKIMKDTFDKLIEQGYIKHGYTIMGSLDQREKQLKEIIIREKYN